MALLGFQIGPMALPTGSAWISYWIAGISDRANGIFDQDRLDFIIGPLGFQNWQLGLQIGPLEFQIGPVGLPFGPLGFLVGSLRFQIGPHGFQIWQIEFPITPSWI